MSKVVDLIKSFSPAGAVKESVGKLFEKAGEVISDVHQGNIDVKKGLQQLEELKLNLEDKAAEREAALEKAYLSDTADAREMNEKAIESEDVFVRRFLYYLALVSIVLTFGLVAMLFFVEIPKGNERIVDMALGSLITAGVIQVYNFFFGSSKGSKDNTALVHKLLNSKEKG